MALAKKKKSNSNNSKTNIQKSGEKGIKTSLMSPPHIYLHSRGRYTQTNLHIWRRKHDINICIEIKTEAKNGDLIVRGDLMFSCSVVSDPATPWTAACQTSPSFAVSRSLLKLMSSESVIPSNHLILCHLLLLLPSVFPSIRIFSNESSLFIRWPKYWSFSFSISPSNEYSRLISLGLTGLISLQSKGLSIVFSNTIV